ncbi:SAF domain-containing protein [Acidiferrimicrobium sp. IK]|uniref:SAF domain-containing protein n=1 Tax=Acidiferrimicrobium sp. IK TaxID=2871700 RepID=UPI0021CAEC79|nr:SAF domain-containing protein [Acidiferrimicrobium sp. IK]MCU4187349.1 SAF domain-containing protein [Acidiferrimicrobium sp. IK]
MASTAAPTRTNGQRASEGTRAAGGRGPTSRRHRQLPLVVVGVLAVIGFALAFADASLHLGSREQVLVVAQPLAAGQVLTSGDLRAVRVSTGAGLQVVPVAEEPSVVGRHVAVPLVAGALLTSSEVGAAPAVGSGSDVVAVGLKAGGYPPDLAPGDRVQVVPVASSSGSGNVTSGSPVAATVLAVDAAPAGSGSPTVFSLQVSSTDADEVAALAAAGQASLVEVGSGA